MSTETTRMRTEAEATIAKAQEALTEGDIDRSNALIDDAESLHSKADELDQASGRIKLLQADQRDLDSNRTEVTPLDSELPIIAAEMERKGAKYSPDYRPQNYIKSIPAGSQPKHVLDLCGENVKAEAQAYEDAFRMWMSHKNEAEFRLNAPEWAIKQMTETDADGGYYAPESFIARNVDLYLGKPGGTIRELTTNIRVASKDGYAPSMAALTWAAMTEATAPSAVKPTIGQVAFTLEKSGSLVQISDELLEDEAMNVPDLLAGAARTAAGQFQNKSLLNGTGAWGGILQASIGSNTAANAASIVAADLTSLYYDIDADFRNAENASWVTLSSTAAHIAAIGSTAAGVHQLGSLTESPSDSLLGKRFLQDDNTGNGLEAIATGNDTVLFGDFAYCMLFERNTFSVSRDESRYWDAGLVGYKFTYRMGSATANAAAFTKLVQA